MRVTTITTIRDTGTNRGAIVQAVQRVLDEAKKSAAAYSDIEIDFKASYYRSWRTNKKDTISAKVKVVE